MGSHESVFGPLLWNIAFDNIPKEDVPPRVNIICFADNTLVVMAENDIPIFKRNVNTALTAMTHWIKLGYGHSDAER